MDARTLASSTCRRRSCVSNIARRADSYSSGERSAGALAAFGGWARKSPGGAIASSWERSDGVFLPSVSAKNFVHLCQGKLTLVLAIVEMRRKAHAGFRAVVDQDVAGQEFAANFVGVGTFDGNRASALGGIRRGVDEPAARLRALEEVRGQAGGLGADGGDANLVQNVEAGLASIEGRYVG